MNGTEAYEAMVAVTVGLVRAGVTDACVSPGSRCAPISLAFSRTQPLRVHVHHDERAAGFFAVGLAKSTRRPVLITCTSGTAVANFLPAVVEAHQTGTPLVLVTADRPARLRGTGANQTINQVRIFGEYARWLGSVDQIEEPAELIREILAAEGPVHINLEIDEPLNVPDDYPSPVEAGEFAPHNGVKPSDADGRFLAELARENPRGVVVVGSLERPAPQILDFAEAAGWPVLAEPTSGLRVPGRTIPSPTIVATRPVAKPEVVVQFGDTPTSRSIQTLVASAERLVVVGPRPADPAGAAERWIECHPHTFAISGGRGPGEWHDQWTQLASTLDAKATAWLDSLEEFFEGRIARDVAAAAPELLYVGSSTPVRDLDTWMRPRTGLRVLANRGASGIDGFVSCVLGAAVQGPTVGLCGDLTFLHDVSSLAWSGQRDLPAVFVVVNNSGGGIFDLLGHLRTLPEKDELFVTAHKVDIGALTRACGVRHERVLVIDDLAPSVTKAVEAGGTHVLEVLVDRERALTYRAHIQAVVS